MEIYLGELTDEILNEIRVLKKQKLNKKMTYFIHILYVFQV